jgi:EAL domain-containing protein (putative c-di-GMP-specific phosphodiesterase class I)
VNDEFIIHYQPKVDMYNCDVIGVEALIRWMHPEAGLKLPGEFLSLVNETELELEMGEWVFDQVLLQVSEWQGLGIKTPVGVNISAYHLQSPEFTQKMRKLFKRHPDVSPEMLELEVLESSSIDDTNAIYHALTDCREMGISIALDDFGTGYSSLAYFHRLPVDILKIDQSFVRDMLDDPQDLTIVDSVIRLSQAFHHPVIAEGVESIQHASALLQLGCRLGQGYGIGKPMPAEDFPVWLKQWEADPSWRGLKKQFNQADQIGIEAAITSHKKWVANLIGYIEQGKELNNGQLDSKHCPFNYWLHGIGFVQYGDMQQYTNINRLHEQVHAQGNRLVSLKNTGNRELAKNSVKDLITLSDFLIECVQELESAKVDLH